MLQEQVAKMLQKGALEEVLDKNSPGFYARLFLVKKADGTWRPIIDLSALNKFVKIPKFKMDTPALIRQNLKVGSWVFSLDLKDAYFQVPIHKASRKFMRIELLGRTYQFRALPFGLSTSPWVFTKLVKTVKNLVHRAGHALFQYLDDWLGDAPSFQEGMRRSQQLVRWTEELGFLINQEKSELIPKQEFDFVGIHFNLRIGRVSITDKNLDKVLRAVHRLLESAEPTAHLWLTVIGTLTSQELLLHRGKLHKRPIQWFLHDRWRQARESLHKVIPLTIEVRPHLEWWLDVDRLKGGMPLQLPSYSMRIFTDASNQGWGVHFKDTLFQGQWSPQESKLHINILEMRAVRLTLQQIQLVPQEVILVALDNLTVVSYINNEGAA